MHVFLGRILAIVCRREQHFCKILEKRKDVLLERFSNITSKDVNPSLKVAYLEVALALITHRTGITWFLETELWKKILSLYDKSTTVFVIRLMYKFSAEFLWHLDEFHDETNLIAVVGFMLEPIFQLHFSQVTLSTDEERELCERFEPILQMLLSIFSQKDRLCYENKVAHLLLNEKNIVPQIYILFDRVRSEETLLLLCKILFYLMLLKTFLVKPNAPGVVYTQEDFLDVVVMYFNSMHICMQKRNAILVLDYSGSCNAIWKVACKNIVLATTPTVGKTVELQNQMLMIYVVPIFVYVNSTHKGRSVTNESISQFMCKFINMTCEHTARAAYALRDLIQELDTWTVTLQSVKRLTCIKDKLNEEQANIVFQALFFALREYDPTDLDGEVEKEEEDYECAEKRLLVMTYIVDTVLSIVKNYSIKWHESLEVICLNSVVHNILTKKSNLTCKVSFFM